MNSLIVFLNNNEKTGQMFMLAENVYYSLNANSTVSGLKQLKGIKFLFICNRRAKEN